MRDYKANTFQMNNSIFQFGLTPIQFVVYSYLKYCAGNRCACSIKLQTIASVCECSRSSVKRALNVLSDRGFIDIKGGAQKLRGKGHRQTCNRYYCLDIGPFDTEEELFNALKEYTDTEVEAGTMSQAEATALLEKYQ